eukprot:TRINITY_DN11425_c0_g1_i1.p1 TRINITY_DN11425_c0_g1~~TRINITY_DN11425_c0_g1_i1.p1  ORF type:complete len:515 (-),score=83.72 TRINITY_DN11425_c0_g1_i1:170-1714(-)
MATMFALPDEVILHIFGYSSVQATMRLRQCSKRASVLVDSNIDVILQAAEASNNRIIAGSNLTFRGLISYLKLQCECWNEVRAIVSNPARWFAQHVFLPDREQLVASISSLQQPPATAISSRQDYASISTAVQLLNKQLRAAQNKNLLLEELCTELAPNSVRDPETHEDFKIANYMLQAAGSFNGSRPDSEVVQARKMLEDNVQKFCALWRRFRSKFVNTNLRDDDARVLVFGCHVGVTAQVFTAYRYVPLGTVELQSKIKYKLVVKCQGRQFDIMKFGRYDRGDSEYYKLTAARCADLLHMLGFADELDETAFVQLLLYATHPIAYKLTNGMVTEPYTLLAPRAFSGVDMPHILPSICNPMALMYHCHATFLHECSLLRDPTLTELRFISPPQVLCLEPAGVDALCAQLRAHRNLQHLEFPCLSAPVIHAIATAACYIPTLMTMTFSWASDVQRVRYECDVGSSTIAFVTENRPWWKFHVTADAENKTAVAALLDDVRRAAIASGLDSVYLRS